MVDGYEKHVVTFGSFTERPWHHSDFSDTDTSWAEPFAKVLAVHLMLSGPMFKLWKAARDWKPVYESLSYGEPEPMPDDPITDALKELEAKAAELYAQWENV
jgi:hypothetical protein